LSHELPTFVVVGHVNKGKSSVVATLTEDPTVPIDVTPGTTARTGTYTLVQNGQPVLQILDTPGFQEAPAALEWLQTRAQNAAQRAAAVADFVQQFNGQDRFQDEVDLLRNLTAGQAGILYVVDGSRPYRATHEAEMEILRWTGQPGLALINRIGPGDHVAEWTQVLTQFFNGVHEFDAHHASFDRRVDLLQSFAQVREQWRPAVQQAIEALQQERHNRDQAAALSLTDSLLESLAYLERKAVPASGPPAGLDERLRQDYQQGLRAIEARSREKIEGIYRHRDLQRAGADFELLDQDLFSETTWKLFGLTQKQLTLYATGWGALLGGGLDLMVGGLSFGTGALLGALTGGLGAWFGSSSLGKAWDGRGAMFRSLFPGDTGRYRCFGPVANPRFAWLLLDRALSHWLVVRERAHANREILQTDAGLLESGALENAGSANTGPPGAGSANAGSTGTGSPGAGSASAEKIGIAANLPKTMRDPLDQGLRQAIQAARSGKTIAAADYQKLVDAVRVILRDPKSGL
jgi:small GTP-binding protein